MRLVSFVVVLAALPFGWGSQVKHYDSKEPEGSLERGDLHSYRQTRHIHHHGPRRRHRVRGSKSPSVEFPPRIIDHPSDLIVQKDKPATLNCRAEGNPEPTIEWYRNGEYVETSKNIQHPQRILLPGGSLFFYQLKGKSDEGIYMCVARNHLGEASSRNSSLYIAALKDDFRLHPSKHVVSAGDPLVIECLPPRGHPEPTVTWKKDGVTIDPNSGRVTVMPGKFFISYTLKADAGMYVCVATNEAGQKESRGAQVSVLEKPVITVKPEDLVTRSGSLVQFLCEVHGDPKPIVRWNREGGELPRERHEISRENTLRIKHVTTHDSGKYICSAENVLGSVSARGLLVVRDPPDTGQTERQTEIHQQLGGVRVHLDNVTALPSASVYVHWKVLSSSKLTEGYGVLYRLHAFADSDWTEWVLPSGAEHSAIIPALRGGQHYEFKVRPFAGKVYGTESNVRHVQVLGDVLDVSPQNINVTRMEGGNSTIIVSWEAPPLGNYSANITGYKVWCFGNETFNQSGWIVDRDTKRLKIAALASGGKYQVQVAVITNAGIGTPSKPKYVFLEMTDVQTARKDDFLSLDFVLRVLRHPAFIGSAGAFAWVTLMMAAIYICQRHSKRYSTKKHSVLGNGLYRFASEDTIIKHRMDASDSPWLSNTWKSTSCSRNYSSTTSMNSQFLWTETKDTADFHRSTISFERKSEGSRSQIIPLVPDSGSLYGPLHADVMFQSPLPGKLAVPCGRARPVPLGRFDLGSLPPFFSNNQVYEDTRHKLPKKQTDPSSPSISMKDSWIHNLKKELHQVNSAPLSSSHQTPDSGKLLDRNEPGKGNSAQVMKTFSSPKILHYTTSLNVMDLLPFTALPPPPVPPPQEEPVHDPRVDTVASLYPAPGEAANEKQTPPNLLNLSRASFASLSSSLNGDNVLTPEDVAKYFELDDDTAGLNSMCDSTLPRPISSAHTYGYICSPLPSDLVASAQLNEDDDLELEDVNSLKSYRKYCETPTSSISEYESSVAGSLVNGWGSVSEDNYTSARCSMVSSSDGSFLMDASFAKALAVAVDSFCFGENKGTDGLYPDFSPSASPLDGRLFKSNSAENGEIPKKRGKCCALPVLDWNIDWMDEMESKYSQKNRARLPCTNSRTEDPFN